MAAQQVLFREEQHFRQTWLWVVVLGVSAIFWSGFVAQVLLGNSFGSRPASDVELILLFLLMGIGLPFFFYRMSMTTVVQPGELQARFWPFHLRPVRIPLRTLRGYERITYKPLRDYGGWGIRWGMKGKAYNVSGNEGVLLHFYDKKPLLIGSQRAKELFDAIRQAKEGG
ncbi:DUF6141 family protein [Pontibacter russatus]|uniref:DUF6141 family protein n=1 Tax=Pontibacter russatus TaxID=2694929 RepID=UPI00137B79CE|nr:DUF6141 family protein [Pontibacter russatus]